MDDLISREAALKALGECPYNWNDWPEEIQAVYDWESHKEAIENIPAVDAIPVEWLQRKRKEALQEGMRPDEVEAVEMVLWMWQKEQEAR